MSNNEQMNGKTKDSNPSLGEYVYQELLRNIREGKYHPGERIRESKVASELDVSRTPVREALRRLQSEGRLNIEPQRGAVVTELDHQEVVELYALRQHLEGIAARFAAQHATDAEIHAMEFILNKCRETSKDPRELNQLNWELHHAIFRAGHNRFIMKAFNSISDSLALLRGVKYIPKNRPANLHQEHFAIIEAIKSRDPDAADEAAQMHIKQSFKTHLESSFQQRSSENRDRLKK